MVAEDLVSNDEKGPQGETDSSARHTVEKAYRNGHRWREDARVNVSTGCCMEYLELLLEKPTPGIISISLPLS